MAALPRSNLRPGVVEPVVLLISRREIEQADLSSVLSRLKVFLATREDAWRYRGQMTLVVDGYNHDPRELVDIPEVRSLLRRLEAEWPYWAFFFNQVDDSIKLLLSCVAGAVKEVVDLLKVGRVSLQFVLDDTTAPRIRGGISNRARDAPELRELEDLLGQWQPERIERHRIRSREITIAIAQAPDLGSIWQGLHTQQRRRNRLQPARELDVNVSFALRSHSRRWPCVACRHVLDAVQLQAPCRADRRRDRPRRSASDPAPGPKGR